MIIRILGSAAGGGLPQWNCSCRNCSKVRQAAAGLKPLTQSSLAVSADGKDWVRLNASADLRPQIMTVPELAPGSEHLRASPIKAVMLSNGDVDHIAGLLSLRESKPFSIYATERVLDVIESNSVFGILASDVVARIPLEFGKPVQLRGGGRDLGLAVEAFDVPGKVAFYPEDASAGPSLGTQTSDTIGLKVSDTASGATFFYIPGCAEVDERPRRRLKGASLVFFDGTLYTDDEMLCQGLLDKTGAGTGHISMSGPLGSMSAFDTLGVDRTIYVHINNSNPVLDTSFAERRAVEAAGWEIGYDGMEIQL